jgi:hypothetical protein
MGLFGRREEPSPRTYQPEMPPSLSDADLADASRMMDRWDASLGNSDATWDCIEAIARRGGFKGPEATLMEVMDGKDSGDVNDRPWRWWHEAARKAQVTGNDILAGRIFLFAHLFVLQIANNMRVVDLMNTGLGRPPTATYKSMAAIAVSSLARLSPDLLIHDTATGKVDAANALRMAEEISGVTAPRSPVQVPRQSSQGLSGPFNSL